MTVNGAPRLALGVVVALVLFGCGARTPASLHTPTAETPKVGDSPVGTVNLSSGSGTHYGPGPKREPKWFVQWQTGAQADLSRTAPTDKSEDGKVRLDDFKMAGVTGHLFQGGKPGSTFRAQTGIGDGVHQTLELAGDVRVFSPSLDSQLTCDRLIYDSNAKVLQAKGHVRVTGKVGTIGTLEVWATPDSRTVANPDMFPHK